MFYQQISRNLFYKIAFIRLAFEFQHVDLKKGRKKTKKRRNGNNENNNAEKKDYRYYNTSTRWINTSKFLLFIFYCFCFLVFHSTFFAFFHFGHEVFLLLWQKKTTNFRVVTFHCRCTRTRISNSQTVENFEMKTIKSQYDAKNIFPIRDDQTHSHKNARKLVIYVHRSKYPTFFFSLYVNAVASLALWYERRDAKIPSAVRCTIRLNVTLVNAKSPIHSFGYEKIPEKRDTHTFK